MCLSIFAFSDIFKCIFGYSKIHLWISKMIELFGIPPPSDGIKDHNSIYGYHKMDIFAYPIFNMIFGISNNVLLGYP